MFFSSIVKLARFFTANRGLKPMLAVDCYCHWNLLCCCGRNDPPLSSSSSCWSTTAASRKSSFGKALRWHVARWNSRGDVAAATVKSEESSVMQTKSDDGALTQTAQVVNKSGGFSERTHHNRLFSQLEPGVKLGHVYKRSSGTN